MASGAPAVSGPRELDILSCLATVLRVDARRALECIVDTKAYGPLLNGDAYAVVLRIREDASLVVITCHEPP